MLKDERDLIEVLKFELKFLESGGYERSRRTSWRPQYIFEDSPTCMNFNSQQDRGPCSDCVLMYLVPPQNRSEEIPCRHIPFNVFGETLDALYRYGDHDEIEEKVKAWLRITIRLLEEDRAAGPCASNQQPTSGCDMSKGTPLYQKQHPKCANPACPTAFHWTGGGKFFRFRPDAASAAQPNPVADPARGIHGVRHYWLCEHCYQAYTLVYDRESGVVLRSLWPELPTTTKPLNQLSVT